MESRIAKISIKRLKSNSQVDGLVKNVMSFVQNYQSDRSSPATEYGPQLSFDKITLNIFDKNTDTVFSVETGTFQALTSRGRATPLGNITSLDLEKALSIPIADELEFRFVNDDNRLWTTREVDGAIVERSAWLLVVRSGLNPLAVPSRRDFNSGISPTGFNTVVDPLELIGGGGEPISDSYSSYSDYLRYPTNSIFLNDSMQQLNPSTSDNRKGIIARNLMTNFNPFLQPKELLDGLAVDPVDHTEDPKYLHTSLGGNMTPFLINDALIGTTNPVEISERFAAVTALVDETSGIPWLAHWSGEGEYASETDRGKQIAANLVDLLDADYYPTYDPDQFSNSSNPTDPSYPRPQLFFGNENDVPHINEFVFTIRDIHPRGRVVDTSVSKRLDPASNNIFNRYGVLLNDVSWAYGPSPMTESGTLLVVDVDEGLWNLRTETSAADIMSSGVDESKVEAAGKFYYSIEYETVTEFVCLGDRNNPFYTEDVVAAGRDNISIKYKLSVEFNDDIDGSTLKAKEVNVSQSDAGTRINYYQENQETAYVQVEEISTFSIHMKGNAVLPSSSLRTIEATVDPEYIYLMRELGGKNYLIDYVNDLPEIKFDDPLDENDSMVTVGWRTVDPKVNLFPSNWVANGEDFGAAEATISDIIEGSGTAFSGNSQNSTITVVPANHNNYFTNEFIDQLDRDVEPDIEAGDSLNGIPQNPSPHKFSSNPIYSNFLADDLYYRKGIDNITDLGIINRGAPFQTLNLGLYNLFDMENRGYDMGIAWTYRLDNDATTASSLVNGDANILEQITFSTDYYTTPTSVPNPYNLNSQNDLIFEKILAGAGILSAGGFLEHRFNPGLGKEISTDSFFAFKKDYRPRFLSTVRDYYLTTSVSGRKRTDHQKDIIAFNTANLVDIDNVYFTLIAVVQEVDDIDANLSSGSSPFLDSGGNFQNLVDERGLFKYSNGANERVARVTSSSKVQVNFKKNITDGTIQVFSYEYLDEE